MTDSEKPITNKELLNLIHEKCKYVLQIRFIKDFIEVQIPCTSLCSDDSWIPIWRSSIDCEKIIKKWCEMGGEIEND
jgi:hypothetical protein